MPGSVVTLVGVTVQERVGVAAMEISVHALQLSLSFDSVMLPVSLELDLSAQARMYVADVNEKLLETERVPLPASAVVCTEPRSAAPAPLALVADWKRT